MAYGAPNQGTSSLPSSNGYGGQMRQMSSSGQPFSMPSPQAAQPWTQQAVQPWTQQTGQPPGMSNPYLEAQADAIVKQANNNLQYNLLPGVNSSAAAAGGYGGSRQGIAQGLAMGQTQQGVVNALANLYGNAYTNDQQLANQWNIANLQSETARYGADKSAAASMYGADKSAAASMYGADKSAAASMYGSDTNLQIAGLNNNTTQRGQDLNYGLGIGQINATLNGQNLNYNLGLTQNNTVQRGQDLGLLANILQNNTTQNGQMLNFYTNNRQLDQSGARLGMDMVTAANQGYLGQGQGIYNLGLTAQQAPWQTVSGMNSATQPYTGFGTTTSNNNGNAGAGFLGGAIAGGQLYNLFK